MLRVQLKLLVKSGSMKLRSVFYLTNKLGIEPTIGFKKSIIIRFHKNNNYETTSLSRNFFFQNCLLFFRLLSFWLLKKRFNHVSLTSYIVETSLPIKERVSFLKHINNTYPFEFISGSNLVVNDSWSRNSLLRLWWIFFKTAVINVFQKNEQQTKYFWPLFNMLIGTDLKSKSNFYVFRPYHLTSYLYAYYISNRISNVFFISSNTSLYPRRYSYLPKVTLIACSSFQLEEIKAFEKRGWSQFKGVKKGVLEEFSQFHDFPSFDDPYDIGIYSTGHWARINGISRITNIALLGDEGFIDNIHYQSFLNKIHQIIKIKQELGLRVKYYFHPYERKLYKTYNVLPPHIKLLEDNDIEYDLKTNLNSISLLNECKIGISQISTIISDRWESDLKGIYYLDKNSSFIEKKYVGHFSESVVYNSYELNKQIVKLLNLQ